MALAEDDDVIQTFSADRADKTLGIGVLPRRSRRSDNLRDAHRSNAMTEYWTIGLISVPQQIARCAVPRGLTLLIRRIKSRISVLILGRPGRRDRQRQ